MDDRDDLVTAEGFDWLYGEDAEGSVIEQPPAIGAVTEPGEAVAPRPETLLSPHEPDLDEPSFDLDLAEFDASFGPAPSEDVSPFETPTQPVETTPRHVDPPVESSAHPFETAAPPVATPAPSFEPPVAPAAAPPPPPPTDSLVEPEVVEPDAAPASEVVAEPQDMPEIAEQAETFQMEALVGHGAQIPLTSSRGDIIAAGTRKLSLRERLMPAPRGPRTRPAPSTTRAPKSTKAVVSLMVALLSFGISAWRVERVREFFFGSDVPGDEQVEAAFASPVGYEYRPLPEQEQIALDSIQDFVNKMLDDIGQGEIDVRMDMRMLFKNGQHVGGVIITSTDPEVVRDPNFQAGFRNGMGGSGGPPLKPIRLAGTEAYSGTAQQVGAGSVVLFMDPDGFVIMSVGKQQSVAEDVARHLIKANI